MKIYNIKKNSNKITHKKKLKEIRLINLEKKLKSNIVKRKKLKKIN